MKERIEDMRDTNLCFINKPTVNAPVLDVTTLQCHKCWCVERWCVACCVFVLRRALRPCVVAHAHALRRRLIVSTVLCGDLMQHMLNYTHVWPAEGVWEPDQGPAQCMVESCLWCLCHSW